MRWLLVASQRSLIGSHLLRPTRSSGAAPERADYSLVGGGHILVRVTRVMVNDVVLQWKSCPLSPSAPTSACSSRKISPLRFTTVCSTVSVPRTRMSIAVEMSSVCFS